MIFVFVTDTAKAFVTVAENKSNGCEIFNVGTGISTSIKQLAEMMISLLAPSANLIVGTESWKGDIKNLGPANIIRVKTIGFSPSVDLSQGLKALIDWHDRTTN